MVSKKEGATTPTKQKASETIVKGTGKAQFSNGRLIIPEPTPATPITEVIPEEVRKQTNGGIDLKGEKKSIKKNSKRSKMEMTKKQKGAVSHPVNSDLLPLLPKGWKSSERDGYVVISDDKKVERMHTRDCLSKEYFSIRVLPEKVSKVKTLEELNSIVKKSVSAKPEQKPKTGKGQ